MKKIDVCLSPDLISLYPVEEMAVVVVDIFRATSCMVTAFGHGAKEILPVEDMEYCWAKKSEGYLVAAERNGETPSGFDLDNSPFSYQSAEINGAKICVTTTNGTVAIRRSERSPLLLVGAFLNISQVAERLRGWDGNALIVCAGWKGKPNLEDTLFAGALIELLEGDFSFADDAAMMASELFQKAKADLLGFVKNSSHVQRLSRLGIEKDIEFCLSRDLYQIVPRFKENSLTLDR